MIWLLLGVLLWSVAHFVPVLARPFRETLISNLGAGPYRGVFSLVIVFSMALIVTGWRSVPETLIYQLPGWSRPVGILLMLVAFVLFAASSGKSIIKQFIRHPMLTGVVVWSISHLLNNGTGRALVLFGGLGVWAVVQMVLTNRRDGAYQKPAVPVLAREIKIWGIAVVVFVAVMFLHPYFAGVRVVP